MAQKNISNLFLILIIAFFNCFLFNGASGEQAFQEVLNKLFQSYNKGIRPNHGREPVTVTLSIYILAITDIDDKDMTFTASMYFRQSWKDPRLAFNVPNMSTITLEGFDIQKIWEPDTFIVNEINSFQHQTFVPNEFLRIASDGSILKSGRFTVTASCPMDLRHFPFDQQLCNLELESFGKTMSDVRYEWKSNGIGISNDVSTPSHRVMGHRARKFEISLSTGNYSRLAVEILFARSSGRLFSTFFMPMIIFVLVSLLSLWTTSDKIAVIINFFNICFINLFMAETEGRSELPKISYANTLDVYFIICLCHVSLSLLDSLLMNLLAIPASGNQPPMEMVERHGPVSDDVEILVSSIQRHESHNYKRKICEFFGFINIFVKALLLVSFILCNFMFFGFYASHTNITLNDFVPLTY